MMPKDFLVPLISSAPMPALPAIWGLLENARVSDWDWVIDVNMKGVAYVVQGLPAPSAGKPRQCPCGHHQLHQWLESL